MHGQRNAERGHGGDHDDHAQLAFDWEVRKPTNQLPSQLLKIEYSTSQTKMSAFGSRSAGGE
jgi:hypothetical protein